MVTVSPRGIFFFFFLSMAGKVWVRINFLIEASCIYFVTKSTLSNS